MKFFFPINLKRMLGAVRNLRKSYFVKDAVEIVSTCGKLPERSKCGTTVNIQRNAYGNREVKLAKRAGPPPSKRKQLKQRRL